MITVQVYSPSGLRQGTAQPGIPLEDALAALDLHLDRRCGGRGWCDGCLVEVIDGSLIVDGHTRGPGLWRGCVACLGDAGHLTLRIPRRSLLDHRARVERSFVCHAPAQHDPLAKGLGIAIDLGTTTIAAALIDLSDGTLLADTGRLNPQAPLAEDVLSRIADCSARPQRRAVYAEQVRTCLNELITELLVDRSDLGAIVIAGNATMLHLLRNIDPSPLGVAPFTPCWREACTLPAATLALSAAGDAPVHLLPIISGFIGADISAGIVACDLRARSGSTLFIDIGTNGEIVLARDGALTACSAAAGPSFEGRGLSCGTRAVPGAISRLRQHNTGFALHTVDDAAPHGLCGSAYIDLLAEGRRHGWLSAVGRIQTHHGMPPVGANGAIHIAAHTSCSEADIATLLPAKAAIAAAVRTLLEHQGLKAEDLDRILIAGGFGRHLNIANAQACGLLPAIDAERIELVGNTALAGAVLALLDRAALTQMQTLLDRVTVIPLDGDPVFSMYFVEELLLPDRS